MNITVAGVGYAVWRGRCCSRSTAVTAVTTTPSKPKNSRCVSPIIDCSRSEDFLRTKPLTLTATMDAEQGYREADVVIIASRRTTTLTVTCSAPRPWRRCSRSWAGQSRRACGHQVHGAGRLRSALWAGLAASGCCSRRNFCAGRALLITYPSRIVVGRPRQYTATGGRHLFASLLQQRRSGDRHPDAVPECSGGRGHQALCPTRIAVRSRLFQWARYHCRELQRTQYAP